MTQSGYFLIFVILSVAWTLIWIGIVYSIKRVQPEAEVDRKADSLRKQLVFPVVAIVMIGIALSIYFAPFPEFREHTIGKPEVSIDVNSLQWAWILSDDQIPAETVVQFNVTSQDVNHGFAIYDADGRLVTQTQAMPDHVNRLIWKFDEPGEYTIRCLEYCGVGHHIMLGKFTVA